MKQYSLPLRSLLRAWTLPKYLSALMGCSVLGVKGAHREEQAEAQIRGRQVAQPWRARPLCQGEQAATPAREGSLLPEQQPYGGFVSPEGPAGPQLTRKGSLFSGGRRRGQPEPCPVPEAQH